MEVDECMLREWIVVDDVDCVDAGDELLVKAIRWLMALLEVGKALAWERSSKVRGARAMLLIVMVMLLSNETK